VLDANTVFIVQLIATHLQRPFAVLPLVAELPPSLSVEDALRAFRDGRNLVLFDSALLRDRLGRYSFLSANPVRTATIDRPQFGLDPFRTPRQWSDAFQAETVPGLPPFQGGIAGHLSYELGSCFERLPMASRDEFQFPVAFFGLYDWVLAWDHLQQRVWLISQGFPEVEPTARQDRAAQQLVRVQQQLDVRPPTRDDHSTAINPLEFAPQFELPGEPGVSSNFSRNAYLQAVERVIEYIRAGDIFQANLSQRLLARCSLPPIELYLRLRRLNSAPFAGLLVQDDWAIASASPERFLKVVGREIETRPIKGTRQRRATPEADLFTRDELRESEKDTAENVMIVDLLRNDLSRVCAAGSISVPQLCVAETYETVQHLVSEIRGRLADPFDVWDLLAATFPGGSITGAPKVRAMEIIAELEPTVRGPYCGSLFYVSADGTLDSSILIRSFVQRSGWVQCCAGGGIVAQSDPIAEYEETLHKAEGMLRVLRNSR